MCNGSDMIWQLEFNLLVMGQLYTNLIIWVREGSTHKAAFSPSGSNQTTSATVITVHDPAG